MNFERCPTKIPVGGHEEVMSWYLPGTISKEGANKACKTQQGVDGLEIIEKTQVELDSTNFLVEIQFGQNIHYPELNGG